MLDDDGANSRPLPIDDACATVSFPPLGPHVNVLMIWPRFERSYWEGMMEVLPENTQGPPLALVTIAALLPKDWTVRLVDCAFDPLRDDDIQWANLVMVSAMYPQRAGVRETLTRCRALGRRTIIGGPYASSQPEEVLPLADHVVVGEVDECFGELVADFQSGSARKLYRVVHKPDVTRSPVPRFDLLRLDKYLAMAIQFSRGCPFQCEFCDIITIYGRRPRTKTPAQVIAELEALYRLGWRSWIMVGDDNFVGNHRAALELSRELARWQKARNFPFAFYTEASIDLSERPELLDAMVEANFVFTFIGIETPASDALREAKKFQNLRHDTLDQVRRIQARGLWITAGFIVGFDSDDAGIFGRQLEFIEAAAIPWALLNILQAPPTTPLYDRLRSQGRLRDGQVTIAGTCNTPNFLTVMPPAVLYRGTARILRTLYAPRQFFDRAIRSFEAWVPAPIQRFPRLPNGYWIRSTLISMWKQGVLAHYRWEYWRFWAISLRRWWRQPTKLGMACMVMVSADHFCRFAAELVEELETEADRSDGVPGYTAAPAAAAWPVTLAPTPTIGEHSKAS
jgi:radical SAM superfamily enzyme YgiQ (UPF0313 family)